MMFDELALMLEPFELGLQAVQPDRRIGDEPITGHPWPWRYDPALFPRKHATLRNH
jgi:hypothetical protein